MSNDNRPKDQSAADAAVAFAKEELLGARHWRRSKLGALTGASTISDAGRSFKANASESTGRVRGLFQAAFRKDTSGRAISDEVTDPRERFLLSMQVNGRTPADIAKSVENTYYQFWLYVALMAATLVLGFFTFPRLAEVNGVTGFVFSVLFRAIPLPLLGALALRAGWTNWIFRRVRLEGLAPYLNAGYAMLPRKTIPRRGATPPAVPPKAGAKNAPARRGAAARVGLAAAAGLGAYAAMHLMPGAAWAAGDAIQAGQDNANRVFVDPSANDMFIRLLTYVIPNAGPIPANAMAGGAGPYELIRNGLTLFAATLLFIGMLMSGWQIITGIVASAKEGTAIGRNYHEVWAPVRTVIGYGMLVPVANGLCGAQILCLYLIAWGGNLANIIWIPYVEKSVLISNQDNAAQLAAQAVDTVASTVSDTLMQQVFEKELCRATIKTMKVRGGFFSGDSAAAPDATPPFVEAGNVVTNYFNKNTVHVADYGKICGTLEVNVPKQSFPKNESRTEYDTNGKEVTAYWDTGYEDNRNYTIGDARLKAVTALKTVLAGIADKAAATYQTGGTEAKYFSDAGSAAAADFANAKRDYLNTLKRVLTKNLNYNTSASAMNIMQQMKKDAMEQGWAKAGTYYLTMARMQSNMYSALYGGVKASPLTLDTSSATSINLAEYLFSRDRSSGIIPQFRTWWGQNIGAISQDASANLTKAGSNSVFDSISDFSLWTGSLFMHLDVNPLDPMGAMIEYGDFLMRTGFGIYLTIQAIEHGSSLLNMLSVGSTVATGGSTSPALIANGIATLSSAAFKAISTPLTIVAGAIIMAGAVHSYVIPMLPYILTLFFISGMLILAVESLVAAPLWAFFHIRLDGQEFIDQVQKPGYMIAFNLLLRPVLMIFGLILSLLTFGAMSWFVNQTFMPVANGLAASTTIGPIGAAVLVVLLAYINLNLASKSFHLITEIPDRVTRWFGQNGERMGEERDGAEIKGAVLAAVGQRGERAIGAVMTSKMIGQGDRAADQNGQANQLAGRLKNTAAGGGGAPPPGAKGGSPAEAGKIAGAMKV